MISNSHFSLWSKLRLNNFSKVEEWNLHCAGIFIFSLLTVFDENVSTNHQSLFISLHKSRTRTENQNLKETWNVRNIIQVFLNPEGHVCQCTFTFRWSSSLNLLVLTKSWSRALPNERVQIHFEEFNLQGTPPEWVPTFHLDLDV